MYLPWHKSLSDRRALGRRRCTHVRFESVCLTTQFGGCRYLAPYRSSACLWRGATVFTSSRGCRGLSGEGSLILFTLAQAADVGAHQFRVYDCGSEYDALVDQLATAVRDMYLEPEKLNAVLQEAAAGLDSVVDSEFVSELLREISAAAIPHSGVSTNKPAHLDLSRNEIAEVIATVAVSELTGAKVPAARVRNKEVRDQPARGLDLLALKLEPELELVVSEVKASSSSGSPPAVVDSGNDCLREQLRGFVADRRRLFNELNWCIKHCTDEELKLRIAESMLRLARDQLPILAFPVLVRPSDVYKLTDFGQLRQRPVQLEPAGIHFCLARIPVTLEQLAEDVYSRARVTS